MKHHKKLAALLAVAAMILTAVVATPATAREEPLDSHDSGDPVDASQPARNSGDGTAGARVAREATADADNAPLSLPPSGIPAPNDDIDRPTNNAQPHLNATSCNYASRVDNPHISRNQQDVSVHGWWQYYSGDCETATVQVWLYHLRCYPGTDDCIWEFTAYDKVKKMPRNAPLYMRANARHSCVSKAQKVGFKAVVDVNIDDMPDPDDRPERYKNVYCVPWW